MKVEFVDERGDLIIHQEMESNPFRIGEKINIVKRNHTPKERSIKEINKDFKIINIEHYLVGEYYKQGSSSLRSVVTITLEPIE